MLLLKLAVGSGEEVSFDSVLGSISTKQHQHPTPCTVQFLTSSTKGCKSYQKQDGHTKQEQESGCAQTKSALKSRVTARGRSNPGLPLTLGRDLGHRSTRKTF